MSKARNLAALMGGGSSGVVQFAGTGAIQVPGGTTAQRPTGGVGEVRYNSDTGLVENYNSAGWQGIDAPPVVTGFTGVINLDTTTTITINGSNFKTGAVVYIDGAGVGNVNRSLTTTFVSSSQVTASTNATSVNFVGGASFNIRLVNPSGLSSTLSPAGPCWGQC